MTKQKQEYNSEATVGYRLTEHELGIVEKRAARKANTAPFMKSAPRQRRIGPDHPNVKVGYALMFEELGVENELGMELLEQLAKAAKVNGKVDLRKLNFLLSFVKDLKPRDAAEIALISQMSILHMRIMNVTAGAAVVSNDDDRRERHERWLNQLMRTFILQAEALKRYRSNGEQKIVVQKVTVAEGGQAIVGNVKHEASKPPRVAHEDRVPMPVIEGEVGVTLKANRNGDNNE